MFFLFFQIGCLYSADVEKIYNSSKFNDHLSFQLPCAYEKWHFRYFMENISLAVVIESITVDGETLPSERFIGFVEYIQDTNTRTILSKNKKIFYELDFHEIRIDGKLTGEYRYIFIKDGENYTYKLNKSMKNVVLTYRILFPMLFPNYQKVLKNLQNEKFLSKPCRVQLCFDK